MENESIPSVDPEQIKCFLHNLGLITIDEHYAKIKRLLKRRQNLSKLTNEQIQRKLIENNLYQSYFCKTTPLLYPRKRTSFSLTLTRKRGKTIKTQMPSTTKSTTSNTTSPTTTVRAVSSTKEVDTKNSDQPLDLRVQSNLINL